MKKIVSTLPLISLAFAQSIAELESNFKGTLTDFTSAETTSETTYDAIVPSDGNFGVSGSWAWLTTANGVDFIKASLSLTAEESVYIGSAFLLYFQIEDPTWDGEARLLSEHAKIYEGVAQACTVKDGALVVLDSFNWKGTNRLDKSEIQPYK